MYRKIFITGASGFVGKNLCSYFSYHLPKDVEVFYSDSSMCDLRDLKAVKNTLAVIRPDCIIHLAALCGGIGANKDAPGKFMRVNLQIGLNTINTALELGCVKKFVNVGSICAYPKYCQVPFKEEDLWNGYPEETNAPYGIAKKTLTELLIAYNKQYGFNSVNLYPTNMYGPHDWFNLDTSHVIPAIILKVYQAMAKGEDKIILWGTGKATRDFLYVQDFCRAVKCALYVDPGPEPINIGTQNEYSIYEVADTICDLMGFDGQIVWDDMLPDGQPRRCVDNTRAQKLLKCGLATYLKVGLIETIDWFINAKKKGKI